MFGDTVLWVFILPGLLLGSYAQSRLRANVAKYSRVRLGQGMTGAGVAQRILQSRGLGFVRIEPARGVLSDHYDPQTKTLRLSEAVYGVSSVAAAGIAAHEVGHAIQDAEDYLPLEARSRIVPLVRAGSTIAPFIFFAGAVLGVSAIIWAGAVLFGVSSLFALITLPVEFDASRRAAAELERLGIMRDRAELEGAEAVLRAAAWTYVAAAVAAVGTWLMYLMASRRR